jgi:hypothetical protein
MTEDYDGEYNDSGDRTVSELEEVHSTLEEILSTLKSRLDFTSLFWLLVFIYFLEAWPGSALDRWTDKEWYSLSTEASDANITIEKRPTDCDFLHAPLGNKGCDYKKRSDVFGDEQRRALIQRATTPEDRQAYEQRPSSVTVSWAKTED